MLFHFYEKIEENFFTTGKVKSFNFPEKFKKKEK